MNQAILRYVADYGEITIPTNPNNSVILSYNANLEWLSKYILPYIEYQKVEKCTISNYYGTNNSVCVYMNNGDIFGMSWEHYGGDIAYCVDCKLDSSRLLSEDPKKNLVPV